MEKRPLCGLLLSELSALCRYVRVAPLAAAERQERSD
jgi:hypothetical protein